MFSFFLFTAAQNGRIAVCELLIKRGSNINAMNKDGNTPLHYGERFLNNKHNNSNFYNIFSEIT